nr:hypothetical protein [uncultured Halomonas sp.]
MGTLFSLRHPLPRRTLIFCHSVAQLGWLLGGIAWLFRNSPFMTSATWLDAWPTLVFGAAMILLAMVGTRLIGEFLMLPYHVRHQLQGLLPGSVVTRSFERRPGMYDPADAWVNEVKPVPEDEGVVGDARVLEPRRKLTPRNTAENPDANRQGTSFQ